MEARRTAAFGVSAALSDTSASHPPGVCAEITVMLFPFLLDIFVFSAYVTCPAACRPILGYSMHLLDA